MTTGKKFDEIIQQLMPGFKPTTSGWPFVSVFPTVVYWSLVLFLSVLNSLSNGHGVCSLCLLLFSPQQRVCYSVLNSRVHCSCSLFSVIVTVSSTGVYFGHGLCSLYMFLSCLHVYTGHGFYSPLYG